MARESVSSPASRSNRKKPVLLCRDQTFVTINIDDHENEGKQTFMLHRGLLCSQSPYFAAAFKKHFAEAVDRSIHLPDVCGATMRLFQFWLYGRSTGWPANYYIENKDAPNSDSAKNGNADAEPTTPVPAPPKDRPKAADWVATEEFLFQEQPRYLRTLTRLYIFADFYDTPQLRNDVMTLLIELTTHNIYNRGRKETWSWDIIANLYLHLPSTSPLRKYAVLFYSVFGPWISKDEWEDYPKSFMIDLLTVNVPLGGTSSKERRKEDLCDPCIFHGHRGDKNAIAACKKSQQKLGPWLADFLRACMSEVYDYDDARLLAKSNIKTGDSTGLEAAVQEEKDHAAVPSPASVAMANEKVEVDDISRGVDDSSDTGLLNGGQHEAISDPTVNPSP